MPAQEYQECTHCGKQEACKAGGTILLKLSLKRPILVNLSAPKNSCQQFSWGAP